jgi:hypothetical protein
VQKGPVPRTVYLEKDGEGWWVVQCRYHAAFVWELKREIPGSRDPNETKRKWVMDRKIWKVHPDFTGVLLHLLNTHFKNIIVKRDRDQPGRTERRVEVTGRRRPDGTPFGRPAAPRKRTLGDLFGMGRAVETDATREEKRQDENRKLDPDEFPEGIRDKIQVVEEPE